jgi:hypothetical protein
MTDKSFFDSNLSPEETEEIKKEYEEEQERFIQEQYDKGKIPDKGKIFEYVNGNGNVKAKKKNKNNPIIITSEKEIERNKILNEIQKLRQENFQLTFEEWSNTLKEKRIKFNDNTDLHRGENGTSKEEEDEITTVEAVQLSPNSPIHFPEGGGGKRFYERKSFTQSKGPTIGIIK